MINLQRHPGKSHQSDIAEYANENHEPDMYVILRSVFPINQMIALN